MRSLVVFALAALMLLAGAVPGLTQDPYPPDPGDDVRCVVRLQGALDIHVIGQFWPPNTPVTILYERTGEVFLAGTNPAGNFQDQFNVANPGAAEEGDRFIFTADGVRCVALLVIPGGMSAVDLDETSTTIPLTDGGVVLMVGLLCAGLLVRLVLRRE